MDVDTDGTVVILTALNLEYDAVRAHLTDIQRIDHPAGTLFEMGRLAGGRGRVVLSVAGEGNTGAAVLTERAITMFQPKALMFVGVAGALKAGVELGDVVVATRVYLYHGGKEDDDGFSFRPRGWEPITLTRSLDMSAWQPGKPSFLTTPNPPQRCISSQSRQVKWY